MTESSPTAPAPTGTIDTFKSDLASLVQRLSDPLAMTPKHASIRSTIRGLLLLGFYGGVFLVSWRLYPEQWQFDLQEITLGALLANATPFLNMLRHFMAVYLAGWIALRVASLYLDDIFELKDVEISERFIRQAVYGGGYDTITIKAEEEKEAPKKKKKKRRSVKRKQKKKSPILKIGGPGKVIVHLEKVALFEKIDGTPHVIGPTRTEKDPKKTVALLEKIDGTPHVIGPTNIEKKPKKTGKVILEGFERLRKDFDLRDRVMETQIEARTRDGIKITARDVRLVYSIYRGDKTASAKEPYPFVERAIEDLVYNRDSRRPWSVTTEALIWRELSEFIAQSTLSEFLASISGKEKAEQEKQKEELNQKGAELSDASPKPPAPPKAPPPFVSRPEISGRFYPPSIAVTSALVSNFREIARNLGIEVKWIGVGTWETPEIIPEKHLEAWNISRENYANGNQFAIGKILNTSRLEELFQLIEATPIKTYKDAFKPFKDPNEVKEQILLAYREKLQNAWDLYRKEGETPPAELTRALRHLKRNEVRFVP